MHVSIRGSFSFILTSINRRSMSLDKWLKILLDFTKEISMLILKILPIEMNESLIFHHLLLLCKYTSPIPGPHPANCALFFGSAVYKSGIHSSHSNLVLLQKQKQKLPGAFDTHSFTFFPCQGSEDVRVGSSQSSPALGVPYLPMQCFWTWQHLFL